MIQGFLLTLKNPMKRAESEKLVVILNVMLQED